MLAAPRTFGASPRALHFLAALLLTASGCSEASILSAGDGDGGAIGGGADGSTDSPDGSDFDAEVPEEPFEAQFVWPVPAWLASNHLYPDGQPHTGSADFAVPYWTPVAAARDGVVTSSQFTERGGYTLYIEHEDGYETLYSHLSEPASVEVGDEVTTGQVIGYSGRTGNAFRNGAHVHFAMFKDDDLLVIPDIEIGEWVHRGEAIPGTWDELSVLDDPGPTEFEVDVTEEAPLFAGPSQSSESAGSVHPGLRVTVVDSDVGYYRVASEGRDGWLVHTATAPIRSELQLMRSAADVAANVRSAPGVDNAALGTIPRGELITTFEKQGEWYKLLFGLPTVYGWTHESNTQATSAFTTRIRTQAANVRSGPSIEADTIGSLQLVDVLSVDQTQEGWYRIDFDGGKAWVAGWLTQGPM